MDKTLVLKKLQALRRRLDRIESKRPADPAALRADYDLRDILSVNLERAVQVCVDIAAHLIADTSRPSPETMAACFAELRTMSLLDAPLSNRLSKAVGFRNIAVHGYQEIDWTACRSRSRAASAPTLMFADKIAAHLAVAGRAGRV